MKVVTNYPLCLDSEDYKNPDGSIADDNVSVPYIQDLEAYIGRKFSYLELGCAGGSIITELVNRGHDAYGLEGTDHPIKIGRQAWNTWHNTRLFTVDLSKPFDLLYAPKFDVISNWEFFEHIPTESLDFLIAKLYTLIDENGIIVCGISSNGISYGCPWHVSAFPREVWENKYFSELFDYFDYPLSNTYRPYTDNSGSFLLILKPKKNKMDKALDTVNKFNERFK